jgi:hypothetical protein
VARFARGAGAIDTRGAKVATEHPRHRAAVDVDAPVRGIDEER